MPRSALWLGGAAALAALIVVGALLLPAAEEPPAAEPEPPATPAPRRPEAPNPPAAPGKTPDADDAAARALFEAARTAAAFREVWLKYPSTTWGRRAEERFRELDRTSQAVEDRAFTETRRRAEGLRPAEAVAAWKAYLAKAAPEQRAKAEAAAQEVENRDRSAFNETVAKARDLAEKRSYAEAAALFDGLGKGATSEVAARCAEAAAQLRAAAVAAASADGSAKLEEARQALRETAAPQALAALRGRRYADALDLLKAAGPLDAELKPDRALVEQARAFWGLFLKAAQARAGRDVTLPFAGGKKLAGRLGAVEGDRATLQTADGEIEVPLDQVALDGVLAWTLAADTYLPAALFCFAEGRDDLASTYLATAKEKGVEIAPFESAWREGYLRAAVWAAAQPPPAKKP